MKNKLRGFVCVLSWGSFYALYWLSRFRIVPEDRGMAVFFLAAGIIALATVPETKTLMGKVFGSEPNALESFQNALSAMKKDKDSH